MQPGMSLTPSLRLVTQLGVGGMGSVWIAENLALRTRVAVKFMSRELAENEAARMRFAREAAAASQVKSAHVVQIFDHGVTAEGVPFIAMELLEGEDLSRRLQRRGPPSSREVATIVWQTAKALSRAHERGIVHRDIKPENIFLCESGDDEIFVKVLDFGIAKVRDTVSNATRTGALMGTAYYMSPEQIVGSKQVDHRTDIWALGVVVYEMLTGVHPFDGETVGALALAIHALDPAPPRTHRPDLPMEVDAWFARACARDLRERFQTVKEMALSLAASLDPTSAGTSASDVTGALRPSMPRAPMTPTVMTRTTAGAIADAPEPTPASTPRSRRLVFFVAGFAVVGVVASVALHVWLHAPDPRVTTSGAKGATPSQTPSDEPPQESVEMLDVSSATSTPSATPAPPPAKSTPRPKLAAPPKASASTTASASSTQPTTKVHHEPALF